MRASTLSVFAASGATIFTIARISNLGESARMTRMIELGVTIPSGGANFSRERMARVAEAARELGYDHVWAGEHLVTDSATAESFGRSLDPVASLAWVAGRVEGIGIGTSVVLLSMHHPFRVAREAGTLQLLSGGRFNLGIGAGWNEAEFRLAGYGFRDRGDRTDEALRVVEVLWAGETSFHGEFWSFDDAVYHPRPEPPPPIWIGGNSARALARARRHGAVWHPNGLPEEQFAPLKDAWDGRIVPRVPIVFDRELDDWYTLSGSEQAIAARLDQALAAGADGFLLSFPGEDGGIDEMHRFASEVKPRLGRAAQSGAD
jgi:probable F420-dependent oxidoreductase